MTALVALPRLSERAAIAPLPGAGDAAGFGNDLEMVFRDAQVAVLHVFLQLFVLLVMFAMISHDSCHIVHDGELRRGTAHVGALLHLRDALLSEHWCMRMRY